MQQKLLKVIEEYLEHLEKWVNVKKAEERKCWLDEVKSGNVVSNDLKVFLMNQYDYYWAKDREYGNFLYNLIWGKDNEN